MGENSPESFVLGLCCQVCIPTVVRSEMGSGRVHVLGCCCQPDPVLFSCSRRSRSFLTGEYGFCHFLRPSLRSQFFFPGHCIPGMQLSSFLEPGPKGQRSTPCLPTPPCLLHIHMERQRSKYLLARALPWAFLNFILLQLWLPWIRMLRPRTGAWIHLLLFP